MYVIIGLVIWQCMVTQAILKCPLSIADWNRASMTIQCKELNYYHCLRDENGNLVEKCLQKVWIQDGMCPEYNSRAKRIDVYVCNSRLNDCPTATFWSNAVYLYPRCLLSATTTTAKTTSVKTDVVIGGEKGIDNTTIIIVTVCTVVLIILTVCAVFIWRKRKRQNRESAHTETGLTYAKNTRGDVNEEQMEVLLDEMIRNDDQHSTDADKLEENGAIIFISDDKPKIDLRMKSLDSSERFGESQYSGSLSVWDPDKDISLYLFPYTFSYIKSAADLRMLSGKFEKMYKQITLSPKCYFVLSVSVNEWRRYESDLLEYDFFRKALKLQM